MPLAAEPQLIKVGVQLPVTGVRAAVGRLVVNGLEMALNDINGSNINDRNIAGRNVKQALKFEIRFADDNSTPEGADTVAWSPTPLSCSDANLTPRQTRAHFAMWQ